MPLISGPSYRTFITLFTGLAVGSLLGSAIFSLIPQAFALHLQPNKAYLWKSLVIFLGIYLFYCSERILRIYFDGKTRQRDLEKQQGHLKKNKSSANVSDEGTCNDKGDEPKCSSSKEAQDIDTVGMTEINLDKDPNEVAISSVVPQDHSHHHHHSLNPQEILANALKKEDSGRRAGLPRRKTEIAPLAWMIIIGDGLHNFIDGLSIGAAFSESTFLGFSTSLAVIFEEFPHELGDFAVLISSGMTVRQALIFNFLSACTCYIGMIFGILLGDLAQSASYIFALAGGMFLYISLVDMMGELNAMLEETKHSTRETSHILIMQNIGILSGIVIIFILSMLSNG